MTELELVEKFSTSKITWPLLYKTFVLLSKHKASIIAHHKLNRAGSGRSSNGNYIKNARAYRRAGGRLDTSQPKITEDWHKAWIFFRSRHKDIKDWLYTRKERDIASPVFAFGSMYSQRGLYAAVVGLFKTKQWPTICGRTLSAALQRDFNDKTIRANILPPVSSLRVFQKDTLILDGNLDQYVTYKSVADQIEHKINRTI